MNAAWIDRLLVARPASSPELRAPRSGSHASTDRTSLIATPTALLRIRCAGAGHETVVFVCDTPVFIEHYDSLCERLGATMRVVCLELVGMGFSTPRGTFRFRLEEQARAVADALDVLKLRGCTLAFTCVGAYLAPLIAESRPELVRRVLLIQAPSWEEERRWARRIDFRGRGLVATPYLGQGVMRVFRKRIASRWFEKALAPGRAAPFVETATEVLDRGASWALGSLVQSYFGESDPDLRPLTVPTLALWGSADRTHRLTDKASALSLAPDAQLVSWATAGHCPELEEPERFCDLLGEFMAAS